MNDDVHVDRYLCDYWSCGDIVAMLLVVGETVSTNRSPTFDTVLSEPVALCHVD